MILDEAAVTVMVSDMTMMMKVCCSLTKADQSYTTDYSTTTDTSEGTHHESCHLLHPRKQGNTKIAHNNTVQAIITMFSTILYMMVIVINYVMQSVICFVQVAAVHQQ